MDVGVRRMALDRGTDFAPGHHRNGCPSLLLAPQFLGGGGERTVHALELPSPCHLATSPGSELEVSSQRGAP